MLIKHLERLKQVGLVEEVEKDSFIAC